MENESQNLVESLGLTFDRDKIRDEILILMKDLNFVRARKIKQFMLNCRKNSPEPGYDGVGRQPKLEPRELLEWQKSFDSFHPKYRGFYLENLWREFPLPVGRMRLMFLQARFCYSIHKDPQPRFHIAAYTNPSAYIAYPGHPTWYHIPDDGMVYKVHTWKDHTAMNCGDDWRVHIVFDSLELYEK